MRNVVDDVAEELMETTKDVVEGTLPTLKRWIRFLLLTGWSIFWVLLLGVGYLIGWTPLMIAPAAILALTFAITAYSSHRAKKALEARAKVSLLARAERERLRLERPMHGALSAFDHHYARVHRQLGEPGLGEIEIGLKIEAEVERAREHLFELAKTEARLHDELSSLRSARNVPSISSARDELRGEIGKLHREADKVAIDVQKLSERLSSVKQLSGGSTPAIERRSLEDVLEDLDRTAAAYREIDDDREERLEKMRARAAKLAREAR